MILDPPLYVGKVRTTLFFFGDTGPYRYDVEVVAEETLELPAGVFETFRGEFDVYLSGAYLHTSTEWYVEGIGAVKLARPGGLADVYVLSEVTVAVEPTTWSRVKDLFR